MLFIDSPDPQFSRLKPHLCHKSMSKTVNHSETQGALFGICQSTWLVASTNLDARFGAQWSYFRGISLAIPSNSKFTVQGTGRK
jgi:hypothetical protein